MPVIVGAVLQEPEPQVSNVSLFYRPGGGEPERYVKNHPVPFAEYIPYRSFFRNFSDKVDLVTKDFAKGTELGAFRVEAPSGAYWALPTICFEVAYDGLMRDSVTQPGKDASLLLVQTNNATFGYTAESEQQFAISRIRAIEHGRSVAHVSTVGVSGFIAPDGSVTGKTGLFTAEQRHRLRDDPHGPDPLRPAGTVARAARCRGARRRSSSRPGCAVDGIGSRRPVSAPPTKDHVD